MNIRKIIRETLENLYLEMIEKPHFSDRVEDRLKSEYTNFKDEKLEIQKDVFSKIKFLKNINIDTQDNIAFLLLKGPKRYVYHNPNKDGKVEHSEGSLVWAVVRGNELETIFFTDPGQVPKNTQIQLPIKRLMDYVFDEKGGDTNITSKDITKLKSPPQKNKPIDVKKDELVIIMSDTKWVVDKDNGVVFRKNKPSQTLNVWDLLEDKIDGFKLDEKTKDVILSYMF